MLVHNSWGHMSHRYMVVISAIAASLCPWLSVLTGASLAIVFAFTICSLVWLQEIWIIQNVFKQENIDFTRRFFQRYPRRGGTRIAGFLPHILSAFLLLLLWIEIGEIPTSNGLMMSLLLFLTAIRVFDPLLGCICTWDSIPWSGMLAYFAVFLFATTSALDPTKFQLTQVPSQYTEAFILALLVVVIINLRMAYYEYFCFEKKKHLHDQLKIVLIPLLILSINQVIGIIQSLDLASNLNG